MSFCDSLDVYCKSERQHNVAPIPCELLPVLDSSLCCRPASLVDIASPPVLHTCTRTAKLSISYHRNYHRAYFTVYAGVFTNTTRYDIAKKLKSAYSTANILQKNSYGDRLTQKMFARVNGRPTSNNAITLIKHRDNYIGSRNVS